MNFPNRRRIKADSKGKVKVMKRRDRKFSSALALCALLLPVGRVALAQRPAEVIGASNEKVAGVAAGIAGAGALIGIGVYFAVKHDHNMTGCAHSGPDGLQLTSESDKQTYTLVGEVAAIKPGDRVRVSGKKGKEKSAATREFLVEKVSRDLGPCEIPTSSH
jgi:hypothetical protein